MSTVICKDKPVAHLVRRIPVTKYQRTGEIVKVYQGSLRRAESFLMKRAGLALSGLSVEEKRKKLYEYYTITPLYEEIPSES